MPEAGSSNGSSLHQGCIFPGNDPFTPGELGNEIPYFLWKLVFRRTALFKISRHTFYFIKGKSLWS